uniref:Ethylene-responsive element binding protein 5 n=1 Tax=Solanum tuberosum TaxID=4113 RepID=M1DKY4_SOLTU
MYVSGLGTLIHKKKPQGFMIRLRECITVLKPNLIFRCQEDNLENGIVAIVTIVVTSTEIQYSGVRKMPWGKYKADITNQKVCVWLGTFDRKEEAATTYVKATRMYRDLKAKINFPESNEDNLENEELNLELTLALSGRK